MRSPRCGYKSGIYFYLYWFFLRNVLFKVWISCSMPPVAVTATSHLFPSTKYFQASSFIKTPPLINSTRILHHNHCIHCFAFKSWKGGAFTGEGRGLPSLKGYLLDCSFSSIFPPEQDHGDHPCMSQCGCQCAFLRKAGTWRGGFIICQTLMHRVILKC